MLGTGLVCWRCAVGQVCYLWRASRWLLPAVIRTVTRVYSGLKVRFGFGQEEEDGTNRLR